MPVDSNPAKSIPLHVLVVDDSPLQRRIVSVYLSQWGYRVSQADGGTRALAICAADPPDLVISDWMMPEMDGLAFCRAFRDQQRYSYGYFILLTSRAEKKDVALGLDCGADDFLTKPVNPAELRARIKAGTRIVDMQRQLCDQNRQISNALQEIQTLYNALDSDLLAAKKLQQSLIRERYRDFGAGQVSLILRPSGHVGGDLVGFFPAGGDSIGLFAMDVSGHGISAALMTARLAGYLSSCTPEHNIAMTRNPDGSYVPLPLAQVAQMLNQIILDEMQTEHYVTMLLAVINLSNGQASIVQAGHPHPVLQRSDGQQENLGQGGLPVGLIAGARFDAFDCTLAPGDRLVILSDGVSECPGADNLLLGTDGVARMLDQLQGMTGTSFFDAVMWHLTDHAGGRDFPDDISGILFEYSG